MELYEPNIAQTIINTINTIFSTLFSSLDNNLYAILDKLLFVNENILKKTFFENLLGNSISNSLIIIANSLLVGFTIYYCFKLLFSHFSYIEIHFRKFYFQIHLYYYFHPVFFLFLSLHFF